MNNNLKDAVQEVLQKALQMKNSLRFLKSENERLEREIRYLKVELAQLTLHHHKIDKKQEVEDPEMFQKPDTTASTTVIQEDEQRLHVMASDVQKIKEELNSCIAEMDACIHLIQSRD